MVRAKLRAYRFGLGMTQQEFAEQIPVNSSYYSQIESGAHSGGTRFWAKLRRAYGLTPEQTAEFFADMEDVESGKMKNGIYYGPAKRAIDTAERVAMVEDMRVRSAISDALASIEEMLPDDGDACGKYAAAREDASILCDLLDDMTAVVSRIAGSLRDAGALLAEEGGSD